MAEPVEDDCVRRLRANDAEAWEWFVQAYVQPSLESVRRSLPHRLRARVDGEDVIQDALRRVVVWLRKYDGHDIHRVARVFRISVTQRVADELRKHAAHRRDCNRDVPAPTSPTEQDRADVCAWTLAKDRTKWPV